ncbi:hypothetical protein ACWGRE_07365 [Bacillus velezensis]|uniref:hypothetical protein n=1 Tax=Bacillus amyloliquefaciens group TaxID=1938374 RepID=UPI000B5F44A5|nr:hypothetical protein [Bacillus velezensis]ASB64746.1 hypothetical protein S101413_01299 [Bacillus velezensis]QAV91826.1 hypothetical protein ES966_06280 [Bacillus velezensis]QAW49409.1 hypothetical protein ETK69_06655 [Bacillus velezensis]TWO89718.1 hypothetical protein EUA42_14240 [Bacillus velezensis]UBM14264.1 hypothetical protein LAZ96_16705 [Bacillus velezensis]
MKPTITKEQAEVIESARGFGHEDDWILRSHADFLSGHAPRWYDGHTFDDMDVTTLAAALINGYEIEGTPEDRVREYYDELQEKQRTAQSRGVTFSLECEREGVINTLNLLGIKIEGVNAR